MKSNSRSCLIFSSGAKRRLDVLFLCNMTFKSFQMSHSSFFRFFSNLVDHRFAPVLVTAADMIVDIYQSVIGQSTFIDRQLIRLQELLERELKYQQNLLEVMGMLDTLFASSLPRMEVPCSGVSRPNGLAQEEENASRATLQVT